MSEIRARVARALCCALVPLSVAQADVFINELHYDNAGTDANERIEIIGPAGTSLSGWQVVLYNGSGGAAYATVNLSGTLPNQCGGHGTLAFNVTGIQNGNPDGVALVNASGTLVQFLSYGGVFSGVGGAANGVLSTNIGVTESATTTTSSQSLQLKGTGSTAAQFTWNAPSTASFGSCNVGQTLSGSTPDAAPTLSSSTPANGASGVAANANVVLNFSEAVSVSGSWYSISCSSSGAHPASVSGSGSSRTLDPSTDFSAGESCTVTVLASGVSDTDGTPTPMTSNASFSYTVAGSSGGTVLSNNVPVSGLAGAASSELRYTLAVPSGASNLVFTTSGGSGDADLYVRLGSAPTTSTYTCRSNGGSNAETCTIAAPAAGTWHVLVRGYSAYSGLTLRGSYSTGPADVAPTVSSVSPAAGATNVARTANVTVTFSEAVTLASGWYTLSCSSTGSKSATQTGSGSSYTLDPAVDFGMLETCTFTVIASKVTDTDGTPTVMASNYTASFTTSSAASGYYASVVTSSAAQLRSTLHAVIDDHTRYPYTASTTDTWDILDRADQDPLNAGRVLDIYKNASYAKAAGGNTYYNREHTWPKSLGFPDDVSSNYPYTDTHMLMVSDVSHNSARGNLPFGNCGAGAEEFATLVYNGAGGTGQSNWRCGGYWQVWNKLKGNVARAMFYMDVRYEGGTHGVTGVAEPNLILTDNAALITQSTGNASVAYMGLLNVLLQWHQQDPVDAQEQLRNDVIYSYQGNRNPFIDHPEWAACLYQNVCN